VVVMAPISSYVRPLARALAPHLPPGALVVHGTKGLEQGTLLTCAQVIEEELPAPFRGRVAALSGPTLAAEVSRGIPTAAVVACPDLGVARAVQALFLGSRFRLYTNSDRIGVELCGALKNVVALAAGGCDGLGFGDNAKAALITRSLAEIWRLVEAAGGKLLTVAGLAGLGDVVATCTSRHSRNRWAGEQMARGWSVERIRAATPMVIEGIPATQATLALAARHGVEMPIAAAVQAVLFEGRSPAEMIEALMGREPTGEDA